MSSARVDYIAPWWTYWLHNFPHVNLRLQPIENTFKPQDEDYQQVSVGREPELLALLPWRNHTVVKTKVPRRFSEETEPLNPEVLLTSARFLTFTSQLQQHLHLISIC